MDGSSLQVQTFGDVQGRSDCATSFFWSSFSLLVGLGEQLLGGQKPRWHCSYAHLKAIHMACKSRPVQPCIDTRKHVEMYFRSNDMDLLLHLFPLFRDDYMEVVDVLSIVGFHVCFMAMFQIYQPRKMDALLKRGTNSVGHVVPPIVLLMLFQWLLLSVSLWVVSWFFHERFHRQGPSSARILDVFPMA